MDYIKIDKNGQKNIDAYADYLYHGGEKIGKFDEKNYQKMIES